MEPENTIEIFPKNLDFVLVPLVGFDLRGHRLGMGGGCFDKTFAFLLEGSSSKPLLIGLGYECQEVADLPKEEWDVSLAGVLTERKFILF